MFIRELTRADISAVTDVRESAFANDELFTWMFPLKKEYPNDSRKFALARMRKILVGARTRSYVVVTEPSDTNWNGQEQVLGYAVFTRNGEDEQARAWDKDTLFNRFERSLLGWEEWYHNRITDRSMDRERLEQFFKNTQFDDFYPKLDSSIHMPYLAVSPKHQRKGIGKMLVKYGQGLAEKENVPVSLEASINGRKLYENCGFKIVSTSRINDEGLEGIAMLWEPERLRGKWLDDLGNGWAKLKVS